MLIQGWIAYPRGWVHIAKEGHAAWQEFEDAQIGLKIPTLPLTAYFDPTAYGLKNPYRNKHGNVQNTAPGAVAVHT